MKDVREMLNISYFDKEELSLKEHCDTYLKIKNDILNILKRYDIQYVLAETEVIKDLQKQNTELKEEVRRCEKANVILDNETTELTKENERLKNNNETLNSQKVEAYKIADNYYEENKKTKNNWNELKKMIEDTIIASHKIAINPDDEFFQISNGTFYRVLNMMQELEEKEVE